MKVPIGLMPDEVHRSVDEETQSWVLSWQPCVVEGRFLDAVLSEPATDPYLIRLQASVEDRASRLASRKGIPTTIADIESLDFEDAQFRARLYGAGSMKPILTVNTSEFSTEACVQQIVLQINLAGSD